MSMMLRAMSSALAPSLTMYVSGLSRSDISDRLQRADELHRMRGRAPRGASPSWRRSARTSRSSSSRQPSATVIWPGLLRSTRASITDPISPTSGAAIGWLLSISAAAMSTWMNLASGLHCGASPVAEQPVQAGADQHHDVGCFSASERAVAADCGWSSGSRPLAIDIGTYGMPVASMKLPDPVVRLCVRGALAEHDQRPLGVGEQVDRAIHRLGPGNCRGAGSTSRLSDRRAGLCGIEVAEHRCRDVEVDPAGTAGDRGADRAGDAAADVLGPADAVRGLGERLGRRELVHLLVVALLAGRRGAVRWIRRSGPSGSSSWWRWPARPGR